MKLNTIEGEDEWKGLPPDAIEIGEERFQLRNLIAILKAAEEAGFGCNDVPADYLFDVLVDTLLQLKECYSQDVVKLTAVPSEEIIGGNLDSPADEIGNALMIHIKGNSKKMPRSEYLPKLFWSWAKLAVRIRKESRKISKTFESFVSIQNKALYQRFEWFQYEESRAIALDFPDQTKYLKGLRLCQIFYTWGYQSKELQDVLRQIAALRAKEARKKKNHTKVNHKPDSKALIAEENRNAKDTRPRKTGSRFIDSTIDPLFFMYEKPTGDKAKCPPDRKNKKE